MYCLVIIVWVVVFFFFVTYLCINYWNSVASLGVGVDAKVLIRELGWDVCCAFGENNCFFA